MARSSPSLLRRSLYLLLAVLVIALSVGGLLLSGYLIKLDQEIRTRFAGSRWALPAQVYAAPLDLYPGRNLDAGDLRHELERLGYRPTETLAGPGTFVVGKNQINIDVRSFQFWDGAQPELKLGLKLDGAGIAEIRDLEGDVPRDIVRLDPMLIGSIYPQQQGEDRVLVKLDEVPLLLREGLIAVEDRSFHDHFGISIRGIFRAAFANLRAGHVVQGASTITQQLVKNFFLTSERDWRRKIKESLHVPAAGIALQQGRNTRGLPQRDSPRPGWRPCDPRLRARQPLLLQQAGQRAAHARDRTAGWHRQGVPRSTTRAAIPRRRWRAATWCSKSSSTRA